MELLERLGLTEAEQLVYETLLAKGSATAGELIHATGLKRGNTYNVLARLGRQGLLREDKSGAKARFFLESPERLHSLISDQATELNKLQKELATELPKLISHFRLVQQQPEVRFFEGPEGIERVAMDALTATGEICSYIDNEAVERYALNLDRKFVARRNRLGKQQRILVTDSPFNRTYFQTLAAGQHLVRYINFSVPAFSAVMMIYDAKISYLTLKPDAQIGVIIADAHIAQMHRGLFEYTWSTAEQR
ncbi:hypothetical protein HY523_01460 [Candidatus Berkelbacteria bacterium]|nr:hypothetical protein [Candidatus Berkelbacteria bacterium]